MKTVCVLMSTYNGEKFIEEQIQSIFRQKDVNVYLTVRDDGSNDRTISILKKYEKEKKLKLYQGEKNLGPACNFMELLYNSGEFDYYAFADQDDVWLEEKLIRAIHKLEKINDEPGLYCSNQLIYKDNVVEGMRFESVPKHGIIQAICGNVFSGCTMVFNIQLAKILKKNEYRPSNNVLNIRMHDTWVIAVAEYVGKVVYDQNSYIKYRIHENNTVGLNNNKIHRLMKIIKYIEYKNGRSELAKELLKIDCAKDERVENFALKSKSKIITNRNITDNCGENKLLFLVKIILGWF